MRGAGRPEPARSEPATSAAAGETTESAPRADQPSPAVAPERPDRRATIGQQIIAQIAGALGVASGEVHVEFSRHSADTAAMAPAGVVTIHSRDDETLGRRRWRVEFTEQGRRYTRYVNADVSTARRVVVAKRSLIRDAVVGADDVELAERDDDGAAVLLTDLDCVVGRQVARSIRAGEPVGADSLTAPLLITRGQTVWVACGPVRITATALERGREGERIRFENPRSDKHFRAVVTGPGRAEMNPAPTTPKEAPSS